MSNTAALGEKSSSVSPLANNGIIINKMLPAFYRRGFWVGALVNVVFPIGKLIASCLLADCLLRRRFALFRICNLKW